jgi:predicted MFS family arabinose efflux permease
MQLVPLIAQKAGWRWSFAVLALGPLVGIAAIRRLARVRLPAENTNLSSST